MSELLTFEPGPMDVHTHPRIYDAITQDGYITLNRGQEGKAGLQHYTEVALRSGITAMLAMPNESVRITSPAALTNSSAVEKTRVEPFPIASLIAVRGVQGIIPQEAYIPTGIIFGLDPQTVYTDKTRQKVDVDYLHQTFHEVRNDTVALKIYLANTTGGFNIAVGDGALVAEAWWANNPDKPVIVHAEDAGVGQFLQDVRELDSGLEIPIHIAHVSSQEELEAIILAKKAGMNVTCEVTPHHLFVSSAHGAGLGGYGCMKPTLKPEAEQEFLWAHIDQVDIIASDCAPHRPSDKQAESPTFGVANHSVLMPLLIGAVYDGRLSFEDLYQKTCITPRKRFGQRIDDGSLAVYENSPFVPMSSNAAQSYENFTGARYDSNPFVRPELKGLHYRGMLRKVIAGMSVIELGGEEHLTVSYEHLLLPSASHSEVADV